jgi:Protein of unknown function (DUF3102)
LGSAATDREEPEDPGEEHEVMAATAVAKRERALSRPLKVLIPLIQADLEQGDRAGMQYYADAGDKLLEAKDQVAHGYWGAWVSKNFHLSSLTAQRYMRLARLRMDNTQKRRGTTVLPRTLSEMMGDTDRNQKRREAESNYKKVLRDLETDLYSQEKQTRVDEVQLHREIALELIDVGFKALATRLHPDRGGSKEAMARLNVVRRELIGMAKTRRFV